MSVKRPWENEADLDKQKTEILDERRDVNQDLYRLSSTMAMLAMVNPFPGYDELMAKIRDRVGYLEQRKKEIAHVIEEFRKTDKRRYV